MRIQHISAGAGAMYCGACARDVTLLKGLLARGHDVTVTPLYMPLRIEEPVALPITRVFYSGITAYLQQLSGVFRYMPRFLERLLESERLLRFVSHFAIETRPAKLGPMTVSVLAGRDGRQRKEVEKLMAYLEQAPRPDVVGLTSALLSVLASEFRERLRVPVTCALQGEDSFVQAMPDPYRTQAQELMRQCAKSVDLYLAPGQDYATRMAEFLGVPPAKVRVVRSGVDVSLYRARERAPEGPFTIGYLSIITWRKGLDILTDAFIEFMRSGPRDARLRIVGKVGDRAYLRGIAGNLKSAGLWERCEFLGEVPLAGKLAFLPQCHVFVMPSRIEESRGTAALEALSCGVPILAPDNGCFPEVLRTTGGGVTFKAGGARSLAFEFAKLYEDHGRLDELGRAAAAGIRQHYAADRMVAETEAVYRELCRGKDEG